MQPLKSQRIDWRTGNFLLSRILFRVKKHTRKIGNEQLIAGEYGRIVLGCQTAVASLRCQQGPGLGLQMWLRVLKTTP